MNDPRAPEWAEHWRTFAAWWAAVWEHQASRGWRYTTCTPEHGPATYQQAAPGSLQPVADAWEVNNWVGARVCELHAALQAA